MKSLWIGLLAAAFARAQFAAPASAAGVSELHDRYIEAVEPPAKTAALEELSRTAPVSLRDVQALFDLFMRFPAVDVRQAAVSSLELVDPQAAHLGPLFARYLEEPDPEAKLFGTKGALRVRNPKALPLIEALARKRFAFKSAQEAPLLSEKNAWWAQYEALAALAQWKRAEALPLLKNKSRQAPGVAKLIGLYLWEDSLAQIAAWARSSDPKDRERAQQALSAQVPPEALRQTRPMMLKLLQDPKQDREFRHQLALKIGLSSTEDDAAALVKSHEASTDEETRLMLAAALFASRSRHAVPLLTRYAKENPAAATRAGARLQLRDMLSPADYRPLLEWAAGSDPDPDNRADAARELAALKAAQ